MPNPENSLTSNQNASPILAIHDAILPYEFEGVQWAIANLGDNVETENAAVAELFETINYNLMGMTLMRDCFVSAVPSLECVKTHHNMYVRLLRFIDARTKRDNEVRLDFPHITPVRRVFRRYPVRYFDQKNRWTKRWTELCLYGLSQMAQVAEANTWTNDFHSRSAELFKRPYREAYRLMNVELFNVNMEAAKDPNFLLKEEDFEGYKASELIPIMEGIEHPYTAFFTEDRLRPITTRSVPIGEGITTEGGTAVSPGERAEIDANALIK